MNTYIYEVTENVELLENAGIMTVYGIEIRNANPLLAQNDGEYACIDNISPVYEDVKHLKDLMEELELYPVHLQNVVEDFLS